MSGGVQHHEEGADISGTGQLFTLPLDGVDEIDVFIDGDAAANYAVRFGPNESTFFSDNAIDLTAGTNYSSLGNSAKAGALEVRVTSAGGASDTADIYIAGR